MKIKNIIITFVSAIAILFSTSVVSFAKVVGDKIILGAAISLTGKYSSNGVHTQNGYNMAVDRINEMGGVKVGGKLTSLILSITMMSQIQKEQHNLQKD